MRLSSKRHGKINAFYYKNSTVFHRYNLNGRTTAEKLNWMFKHIAERTDLNKGDLKLVAGEDGVRMINRKTGGRMYAQKISKYFFWYEDTLPDMSKMHEDYDFNK
jgi:hypothetical protein